MKPKEYKIKTIDEIFEVVNEDNVDCFLEDFSNFVKIKVSMRKIIEDFSISTCKPSTGFNWIDDGKNDAEITIKIKK